MTNKEEESKNRFAICPYWRRISIIICNDGTKALIALCGKVSKSEQRTPDPEDFFPRLNYCPFYDGDTAYISPAIIVLQNFSSNMPMKDHDKLERLSRRSGHQGLCYLESQWDQVLESVRLGQTEEFEYQD